VKKINRTLKEILTGSDLVTPTELALALQVSRPTVYAWTSKGVIPFLKFEGLTRFDPVEIAAWLKAKRQGPGTTTRCPYDGTIGRDFDAFAECETCPVKQECAKAASQRILRVAYK
jgi:excisionase family DNA binding protein